VAAAKPAAGHAPLSSQFSAILPARTNHCFGCGPANREGLRLKFFAAGIDDRAICNVQIPLRYEGPPGHVHGGIIATLLDEAMGKANKLAGVIAMTRTMEVEYLKPVPLKRKLVIEGWGVKREGRKHWNAAEIRSDDGEVLARSTGLFIAIDSARALEALARMNDGAARKSVAKKSMQRRSS
jgi:acyl-coenzyme A thioesterase PaaI-like protein